jgi:TRAP transporter TAXI family solute receptor
MRHTAAVLTVLLSAVALDVQAETRVTYKSAKSTSSYYQMAVQVAETVKSRTGGDLILTVEESQGSVQNVKESHKRTGNYVFTTPPSLIGKATQGVKPFEGETGYETIRSLFVIPSLTMHFVVRGDSGVASFADLEGKDFIIGKGSFGARKAASTFEAFGLAGKVNLVDVELNAAVPALKNGKVQGFATAGSYPAPNVMEAAAGTAIRLLSMSDEQVTLAKGTQLVIPGGTYPGVDGDVTTISLPVGAYTTTTMDEDTAYRLTLSFWQGKTDMEEANPWWTGVDPDMLGTLGAPLHPGAQKAYEELGIAVPDTLR